MSSTTVIAGSHTQRYQDGELVTNEGSIATSTEAAGDITVNTSRDSETTRTVDGDSETHSNGFTLDASDSFDGNAVSTLSFSLDDEGNPVTDTNLTINNHVQGHYNFSSYSSGGLVAELSVSTVGSTEGGSSESSDDDSGTGESLGGSGTSNLTNLNPGNTGEETNGQGNGNTNNSEYSETTNNRLGFADDEINYSDLLTATLEDWAEFDSDFGRVWNAFKQAGGEIVVGEHWQNSSWGRIYEVTERDIFGFATQHKTVGFRIFVNLSELKDNKIDWGLGEVRKQLDDLRLQPKLHFGTAKSITDPVELSRFLQKGKKERYDKAAKDSIDLILDAKDGAEALVSFVGPGDVVISIKDIATADSLAEGATNFVLSPLPGSTTFWRVTLGLTAAPVAGTVYHFVKKGNKLVRVAPKGLLNGLETFKFKGAVRIDGLRSATHADITKAFKRTQFTPTNHFITRLKDVRTDALGIKSFKDLETIFRKGSILDADDGLLAIVHNGMAIIVNPQTGRLVTLTPWK